MVFKSIISFLTEEFLIPALLIIFFVFYVSFFPEYWLALMAATVFILIITFIKTTNKPNKH